MTTPQAGLMGGPQGTRSQRPLLLASEYFTRQAADPTSVADALIVRASDAQIRVVDAASRTLRVRITDATLDRYRDKVDPRGADVAQFERNPVVPWVHDYWSLPVARDTGLELQATAIYGNPQFPTRDEYEFADTVYRLCVAGYVNAASIGFMPTKWAFDEERRGYDILEWDLWEYSIVPLPANPSCLIEARSAGIDIAPIAKWAEETLAATNGVGSWVPKEDAEAAYFIAAGRKQIFIPRGALRGIEAEDVRTVLTGACELRDAGGAVLRVLARAADADAGEAGAAGTTAGADAATAEVAAAASDPAESNAAAGPAGKEVPRCTGTGTPGAADAASDTPSPPTAEAVRAWLGSGAGCAFIEEAVARLGLRLSPTSPDAARAADDEQIAISADELMAAAQRAGQELAADMRADRDAIIQRTFGRLPD